MNLLEKLNANIIKLLSILRLNFSETIKTKNIKNILVICQIGIGNCILYMPVIKNLQTKFRESNITIIVNNQMIYDIINHNFKNVEILIADLRKFNFWKKVKFFLKMKKKNFDLFVCNFLGAKKENIQLALFCKIPYRVGHITFDVDGTGKFDFFFNFPISIKDKHELDFNLDLLQPLGFDTIYRNTFFNTDDESITNATNFVNSVNKKYKVIFQVYCSNGVMKNWPGVQYVELARKIKDKYDAEIILVGSQEEIPKIEKIFSNCRFEYKNIAGKFSLFEVAVIIKLADIYLGNDSGLGHISATLEQNTISIIGMTDKNRVRPIGKNVFVIHRNLECSPCDTFGEDFKMKNCSHKNCLKLITVDEVFGKVKSVLDRKENR